jgi:aldose sugar dehydrogenase
MTSPARLRAVLTALFALAVALPVMPAAAQTGTDADLAYEVLAEGVNEPMQLEIAGDGRLIWAERDGSIVVMTPEGVRIPAGELLPAANVCETCTPEPDYLSPFDDPATVLGRVVDDPQGQLAACQSGPTGDCALATRRPNRLGAGGLEEGGLHGLLLHRDFDENGIIFTYRSVAGTRQEVMPGVFWGEFRLSTFHLDPLTNLIDPTSEEVLLTVPAEWDHCCHYAGDIDYLPDGTLILTTGDDVDASSSGGGYGPRDFRTPWLNGEITSANPADRRGKVLRLREDGTVPDGTGPGLPGFPEVPNPFLGQEGYNPYIADQPGDAYVDNAYATEALGFSPIGTPGDGWVAFDPYVYALGYKQPWRAVVHPGTGKVYTGDVGPDASTTDPAIGPAGVEEINRIPFGGGVHGGWPRCIAENWPYMDVDWSTGPQPDDQPLDCSSTAPVARPIGSTDPAEVQTGMDPSYFWYGRQASEAYPTLGSGGVTSEPTLFYPGSTTGALRLPERYDDRMILLEWTRNLIIGVGYDDATGDLRFDGGDMPRLSPPQLSLTPDADNVPGTASVRNPANLFGPTDAEIGPDGALYMVEYGVFYYVGETGRVSRIRPAAASLEAIETYGVTLAEAAPATAMGSAGPLSGALLALAGLGIAIGSRRRGAAIA